MSQASVSVSNAFVCDDYRVEANGKGLVIGLYGNNILFEELPTNFKFFVCLIGSIKGVFQIEVRVKFVPSDEDDPIVQTITVKGGVKEPNSEKSVNMFLPLSIKPMEIKCAGNLLIEVKLEGKTRWKNVTWMDVSLKT